MFVNMTSEIPITFFFKLKLIDNSKMWWRVLSVYLKWNLSVTIYGLTFLSFNWWSCGLFERENGNDLNFYFCFVSFCLPCVLRSSLPLTYITKYLIVGQFEYFNFKDVTMTNATIFLMEKLLLELLPTLLSKYFLTSIGHETWN